MADLVDWARRTEKRNRKTIQRGAGLIVAASAAGAPVSASVLAGAQVILATSPATVAGMDGPTGQEGTTMLKGIILAVQTVVAILAACILIVERPGEGPQKRQEAIDTLQVVISAAPVPGWVEAVFALDAIAGALVDLLVAAMKRWGAIEASPAPG